MPERGVGNQELFVTCPSSIQTTLPCWAIIDTAFVDPIPLSHDSLQVSGCFCFERQILKHKLLLSLFLCK